MRIHDTMKYLWKCEFLLPCNNATVQRERLRAWKFRFDAELTWKEFSSSRTSDDVIIYFFFRRGACATGLNERECTQARYLLKKTFHNRTRYRPRCFSEALGRGVVKRICTHSSAARPSVKRQRKRPNDLLFLSLLFFGSASFNRRRKISFRDYTSSVTYVSNSFVIIYADHVDRHHFLREGGIWGRLRFRRCTRSREIEGCGAVFQSRSECRLFPLAGATSTVSKRVKTLASRRNCFSLLQEGTAITRSLIRENWPRYYPTCDDHEHANSGKAGVT